MLIYLFIGLIVQIAIMGWRTCLGKIDSYDLLSYGPWCVVGYILTFMFMVSINVLIWPISIIAEIINTIKGY